MGSKHGSRRVELINIAQRLFMEQGYERTSVRDISGAAGLKNGSLFHHFDSKETILIEVLRKCMEEMVKRVIEEVHTATTSEERLRRLFHLHIDSLVGLGRNALPVMLFEWSAVSDSGKEKLQTLRADYETEWQIALDLASRDKLIRGDTRLMRKFILGGLHWTMMWYRNDGKLTPDALADQLFDSLINRRDDS